MPPRKNIKNILKNIPILSKLCPWDLLIVIANTKTIGNCFLFKMNGNDDDPHVFNVIRGIKTLFPLFSPVIISVSILYLNNFVIYNLVPLHNPSVILTFRINITIAFTFNFISCGGKPSRILFSISIG